MLRIILFLGLAFVYQDLSARYTCRAGEKCCFNQEDCNFDEDGQMPEPPCSVSYDVNCELCCVARNQGNDPGEEKLEACRKSCSASHGQSAGDQPQNVVVPQ